MNTACWLWQQGVSFAWLALARDQLPQGNWTLSVWNGETLVSTFTFLKICLRGKLSKESIKKDMRPIHKTIVTYAKVHNPRSIYISEECMGLYGISDVPACQVCSFSVLPATNTFSHIHCQYQTIQMLKVKVFREEVKKYIS